jgi:hypothetical protein
MVRKILAIFILLTVTSGVAANEKFNRTTCKKVNEDLVAAVIEIVGEVFVKKYRTTNIYSTFEDLDDCHLMDFKSELLSRNLNANHAFRLLNYTSIPKITSRLRVMNIILLDSLETFKRLYPKIVPEVFFFRGYYLFVLLKDNLIDNAKEIFSMMWKKQIFNVNAIYEAAGVITMSTFRPFKSESCYDISPVIVDEYVNGRFLNGNDSLHLFPKKFENLWKCDVRLVTLERCPAVCEEKNSNNLYGHDWDLILELERLLNFKVKLTFLKEGQKLENSTGITALNMVMRREADIAIGNYFLRARYVDLMDMSATYDSVPVVLAIPPGEKILKKIQLISSKFTSYLLNNNPNFTFRKKIDAIREASSSIRNNRLDFSHRHAVNRTVDNFHNRMQAQTRKKLRLWHKSQCSGLEHDHRHLWVATASAAKAQFRSLHPHDVPHLLPHSEEHLPGCSLHFPAVRREAQGDAVH